MSPSRLNTFSVGYQPGVFTMERHVRGKWVCAQCEPLLQAPVAPRAKSGPHLPPGPVVSNVVNGVGSQALGM